ncbi:MAG: relaxase/mobilization nuclease domain-containing protein [Ruminococcus sp.]|nr:relaxase/mobilization nuclease domain-containing protein [Ruminococcus sp.]
MMPIVHFVNCKSQTAGGMKTVLGYVSQEKKTVREDRKYVTGINCDPAHAYDEMMLTKRLYKKTGGRLYYHLVQSFPKGYDITPEKAHQIACEFAERAFGQYECVVATHIDREHIHSHIVFNSVSFDTGKKYHSDKDNPLRLMNLSDEICRKYDEPVLADPAPKLKQRKVPKMSDRERRSAGRGQSVKLRLINALTDCMKVAKTKEQFCKLLKEQYGISAKWLERKQNITYTMPSGYSFKDRRLLDEKFLKEAMEREFRIRYEIFNGEEQAAAPADNGASPDDGYHRAELAGGGRSADQRGGVAGRGHQGAGQDDVSRADEQFPAQSSGAVAAEQGGGQSLAGADSSGHLIGDDGIVITGWEDERGILLSAERARRLAAEAKQEAYQDSRCITIGC